MTAAMFASLTDSERRELAARLRRAGERLGDEANTLAEAAPSALAAYCLPREGYHDFYSAAIEASMLSVEVWRRPVGSGPDNSCQICGSLPVTIRDGASTRYGPACGHGSHPAPVCRTCGFTHPPEPVCPRWAPEPARLVPTGTGWPL